MIPSLQSQAQPGFPIHKLPPPCFGGLQRDAPSTEQPGVEQSCTETAQGEQIWGCFPCYQLGFASCLLGSCQGLAAGAATRLAPADAERPEGGAAASLWDAPSRKALVPTLSWSPASPSPAFQPPNLCVVLLWLALPTVEPVCASPLSSLPPTLQSGVPRSPGEGLCPRSEVPASRWHPVVQVAVPHGAVPQPEPRDPSPGSGQLRPVCRLLGAAALSASHRGVFTARREPACPDSPTPPRAPHFIHPHISIQHLIPVFMGISIRFTDTAITEPGFTRETSGEQRTESP